MKCSLCNLEKDEAGFKGSHVIPEFLTRSIFNIGENKNKRSERQIIFTSESLTEVKSYIRGASEEEIPEQFRKDLENGEEYNSVHPETVDFIFCNLCEKSVLGDLEGYFSNEIYRKILIKSAVNKSGNSRSFYEFPNLDSLRIKQFIASVIWRCSITNYNGNFKLNDRENEKLRRFIMGESSDFPFSYRLMVCNESNFDNQANMIFFNFEEIKPSLICINNFIIQIFANENQLLEENSLLLGTNTYFKNSDFITSIEDSAFKIPILTNSEWDSFMVKSRAIYNDQTLNEISSPFIESYNSYFGQFPSIIQTQFFNAVCIRICFTKHLDFASQEVIEQASQLALTFLKANRNANKEEMQQYISSLE